MALLQVNFVSDSLKRTVPIQVILPVDKPSTPPYKTLYLLHGVYGNYTDWVAGTNIQRLAEERDLAVVMPSGDNAFYLDQPMTNNNYGTFIGNELIEMTRKIFPLSRKREDTFIAGLSMGGYGALRNSLKYHQTFSHIAALSSAVYIYESPMSTGDNVEFFETKEYMEQIFGDLKKVNKSDKNPVWIAGQLAEQHLAVPDIYLACGKDDALLPNNQRLYKELTDLNIPVSYTEDEGAHEWDFWNRYIKKVLDWLPLNPVSQGINSGNIC